MSCSDPESSSGAEPPSAPYLEPTAFPHIYRKIFEDPALYWDLHDYRGTCRFIRDMIDAIQCMHIEVTIRTLFKVSRETLFDEVLMLEGPGGGQWALPGEPDCATGWAREYRTQIDMIMCGVRCSDPNSLYSSSRCFYIGCLRPLWVDRWNSAARGHALDLLRNHTRTVQIDLRQDKDYSGSDVPPDPLSRQVVLALAAANLRGVHGDRNWLVDVISRQDHDPSLEIAQFRRRVNYPDPLAGQLAIDYQRPWSDSPIRVPQSDSYVVYTIGDVDIFGRLINPARQGGPNGGLSRLVEVVSSRLHADWVIVGSFRVLDQCWMGAHAPSSAPVQQRFQDAVADRARLGGQDVNPEPDTYHPDAIEARVRAIRVVTPEEREREVGRLTATAESVGGGYDPDFEPRHVKLSRAYANNLYIDRKIDRKTAKSEAEGAAKKVARKRRSAEW